MSGLSQTEYAKRRGVAQSSVSRAIASGRINTRPDGRIDPSQADAEWEQNTDRTKPRNSVTGSPRGRRTSPEGVSKGHADGEANRSPEHADLSLAELQRRREALRVEREEVLLRKLRGELLDAAQMRAAIFTASRRARDLLMAVADRLAPVVAGVSDQAECHRLIAEEIRRACKELTDPAKLIGGGPCP